MNGYTELNPETNRKCCSRDCWWRILRAITFNQPSGIFFWIASIGIILILIGVFYAKPMNDQTNETRDSYQCQFSKRYILENCRSVEPDHYGVPLYVILDQCISGEKKLVNSTYQLSNSLINEITKKPDESITKELFHSQKFDTKSVNCNGNNLPIMYPNNTNFNSNQYYWKMFLGLVISGTLFSAYFIFTGFAHYHDNKYLPTTGRYFCN